MDGDHSLYFAPTPSPTPTPSPSPSKSPCLASDDAAAEGDGGEQEVAERTPSDLVVDLTPSIAPAPPSKKSELKKRSDTAVQRVLFESTGWWCVVM